MIFAHGLEAPEAVRLCPQDGVGSCDRMVPGCIALAAAAPSSRADDPTAGPAGD